MTGWLDPLRRALDDRAELAERGGEVPLPVFVRDDDAGWADDALRAVMDRVADAGLPLDVAVIPAALTDALAAELTRRVDPGADRSVSGPGGTVALHQHGWAHADHETAGRRCEFGPSRTHAQQRDDVARGAAVLAERLGLDGPRLFVPPWNRCTATTAAVLDELGFTALCRDATAAPLPGSRLPEVPVTVDWFGKRHRERVDRAGRGELLADAVRAGTPVGVMLHHAVMDADDLDDLEALLRLVAGDARLRPCPMADLVPLGPADGQVAGPTGTTTPAGSAG